MQNANAANWTAAKREAVTSIITRHVSAAAANDWAITVAEYLSVTAALVTSNQRCNIKKEIVGLKFWCWYLQTVEMLSDAGTPQGQNKRAIIPILYSRHILTPTLKYFLSFSVTEIVRWKFQKGTTAALTRKKPTHSRHSTSASDCFKVKVAASYVWKTCKAMPLTHLWHVRGCTRPCFLPLSLSVYYPVNAMATKVLDSFFFHLVQHEAHFLEMSRYVNLIDACQAFRNEYFPSPWYKIHHITFHTIFPPTESTKLRTNTNAADSFHTQHSS